MTFSTRAGFRWVAPLAVAGALAGCHSSRTAFQFTPVAPYASARLPLDASRAVEASVTSATTGHPIALAAVSRPLPVPIRRLAHRRAVRPLPTPARQPIEVVAPAATAAAPAEVATAVRSHRHHAAPARTKESGLGRIALFFLVVLLAVLAGLGALVSLIPGVSFWGGVGLAAAGLLVLFLLYSLLSGGSKKKVKVK